MDIKIYRLTSFAKSVEGGNPAGVVIDAEGLSELSMREIARKVGYSETAFVLKSEEADYKVRFFTPVEEVDLCGHATIATFNLLRDLGRLSCGIYSQETKAGILKIIINKNDIFMEQNLPTFGDIMNIDEIKQCFESSNLTNIKNRPIQIVSTGLRDIIIPVKSIEELNKLKPNFEKMTELSEKYDVVGLHAFTEKTKNNASAICRNFAPRYGIDEESATGTSNGALACYLNKYDSNTYFEYLFEQGYSMNKPSEIKVKLELSNDEINEVYVGGSAIRIDS